MLYAFLARKEWGMGALFPSGFSPRLVVGNGQIRSLAQVVSTFSFYKRKHPTECRGKNKKGQHCCPFLFFPFRESQYFYRDLFDAKLQCFPPCSHPDIHPV